MTKPLWLGQNEVYVISVYYQISGSKATLFSFLCVGEQCKNAFSKNLMVILLSKTEVSISYTIIEEAT